MIIDDLEFINICDQIESIDFATIHGGASASVGVDTSTTGSNASAGASAGASGNISAVVTGTNTVLINQNIPGSDVMYTAGYATSYGLAYGVDRDGSSAVETGLSTSIV